MTAPDFTPTSPATAEYSCISWSVWYQRQVIWPDEDDVFGWPPNVPREETVDAFKAFYALMGFVECPNGLFEPGIEKVAIYAKGGLVTHAARQLDSGAWTSKMGSGADGSHPSHATMERDFGPVSAFMKRRYTGQGPQLPELYPSPPKLITPSGGILIP